MQGTAGTGLQKRDKALEQLSGTGRFYNKLPDEAGKFKRDSGQLKQRVCRSWSPDELNGSTGTGAQ